MSVRVSLATARELLASMSVRGAGSGSGRPPALPDQVASGNLTMQAAGPRQWFRLGTCVDSSRNACRDGTSHSVGLLLRCSGSRRPAARARGPAGRALSPRPSPGRVVPILRGIGSSELPAPGLSFFSRRRAGKNHGCTERRYCPRPGPDTVGSTDWAEHVSVRHAGRHGNTCGASASGLGAPRAISVERAFVAQALSEAESVFLPAGGFREFGDVISG